MLAKELFRRIGIASHGGADQALMFVVFLERLLQDLGFRPAPIKLRSFAESLGRGQKIPVGASPDERQVKVRMRQVPSVGGRVAARLSQSVPGRYQIGLPGKRSVRDGPTHREHFQIGASIRKFEMSLLGNRCHMEAVVGFEANQSSFGEANESLSDRSDAGAVPAAQFRKGQTVAGHQHPSENVLPKLLVDIFRTGAFAGGFHVNEIINSRNFY